MRLSQFLRALGAAVLLCSAAWRPALAVSSDPVEFHWEVSSMSIIMGPAAIRGCFLTRITGSLAYKYNYIGISVDNGLWYLHGSSGKRGISGYARCLNDVQLDRMEYSWRYGEGPVAMGRVAGRLCFLTFISGEISDGDDYPGNGRHRLAERARPGQG